jgi:hypothetical protein
VVFYRVFHLSEKKLTKSCFNFFISHPKQKPSILYNKMSTHHLINKSNRDIKNCAVLGGYGLNITSSPHKHSRFGGIGKSVTLVKTTASGKTKDIALLVKHATPFDKDKTEVSTVELRVVLYSNVG